MTSRREGVAELLESVTGASLVLMDQPSDVSYTPGVTPQPTPEEREALMRAHGIPPEMFDRMGPFGVSPLAAKMGIVFQELTADLLMATMPVAGNEQNAGLLHGGAHLVLGETLGSVAAVLHAQEKFGERRPVVGIEIGASHQRAAASGTVTGTCTPIHRGRTLTTHEIVVTDEAGRRLSTIRMTNMILDRPSS